MHTSPPPGQVILLPLGRLVQRPLQVGQVILLLHLLGGEDLLHVVLVVLQLLDPLLELLVPLLVHLLHLGINCDLLHDLVGLGGDLEVTNLLLNLGKVSLDVLLGLPDDQFSVLLAGLQLVLQVLAIII